MVAEFESANWPEPSHPDRLETQLASWTEAVSRIEAAEDRAFVEGLADDPSGRAMLDCVFGSSPFLGSCLLAEPAYLHRLWNDGARACVDAALAGLAALPPDLPQAADRGRTPHRPAPGRAGRRAPPPPPPGHAIEAPAPLFTKITDDDVDDWRGQFGGGGGVASLKVAAPT